MVSSFRTLGSEGANYSKNLGFVIHNAADTLVFEVPNMTGSAAVGRGHDHIPGYIYLADADSSGCGWIVTADLCLQIQADLRTQLNYLQMVH